MRCDAQTAKHTLPVDFEMQLQSKQVVPPLLRWRVRYTSGVAVCVAFSIFATTPPSADGQLPNRRALGVEQDQIPVSTRRTPIPQESDEIRRTPRLFDLPSPEQFEKSEEPSRAWWDPSVRKPLRTKSEDIPVRLDALLMGALAHSAQIQVIKEAPLIRETAIVEADSEFDWTSFVESQFVDTSDPVGNRLQTGGPTRFREHDVSASVGVRRKNRLGGQFEIAQEVGHRDNNSLFFSPANQGNSRLTLSYTQPILRGAGQMFNTSLTVLAEIDTGAAFDDFSAQLQAQLLDVNRAYWELYLERANLIQKQRLYGQAAEILQELERRRDIDALRSQIVRAQAAVASRTADIIRADMAIRNTESRIRALVNDPSLGSSDVNELVPLDLPLRHRVPMDVATSVEVAFQNRPELAQAIKQIRAASIRLKMSRNELLPALNLVLETYVSGLRGSSDVGNSIVDQYREGEPSYTIGLQYEVPFLNRRAKARHLRRRHELRQLEAQMRATMESLRLEVEVAARDVVTTYREMIANLRAMRAEETEVEYLYQRWKLLPGNDRSASLLLEDLLDAQERLNVSEFAYLNSQLNYNVSHMAFQRAVGTLLQSENISCSRYLECCLPTLDLHRSNVTHEEVQPGPLEAPGAASAEGVEQGEMGPQQAGESQGAPLPPHYEPPPLQAPGAVQPEFGP